MARRVKEKVKPAKPAPSNITAGLVQHWGREISNTARLLSEAQGVHRARLKAAKSAGIDTKALLAGLAMRKRDPEEAMLEVRTNIRYLQFLGLPLGAQSELFEEPSDGADQLTDKERAEQKAWEVHNAGYKAGRTGQNLDSNPHPPGSEYHVNWAESYARGQAAIAAEMGPGISQAAAGKRARKGNAEDGRPTADAAA